MNVDLTIYIAFAAGLFSFISPCTLPLYPAFLSYITGVSSDHLRNGGMKQRTAILHTICFLIGFSLVFIALGYSTTWIRALFFEYDELIRQIGAIFIVFFGCVMVGIWTPRFLLKERRVTLKNRPTGFFGSILIGLVFAVGWTPCTGPILASIFFLAATSPTHAVSYMASYVIGFSLPFLTLAFFVPKLTWVKNKMQLFFKIGGMIMIIVGILLFFDQMSTLNRLFTPIYGDFIGF